MKKFAIGFACGVFVMLFIREWRRDKTSAEVPGASKPGATGRVRELGSRVSAPIATTAKANYLQLRRALNRSHPAAPDDASVLAT